MALEDALRAWVDAALRFIAQHNGFERTETDTWQRRGDKFFRHTWQRLVYDPRVAYQAMNLPEFRAVLGELLRDPVYAQMFGHYVGPATGMGVPFNEVTLLNGFLPNDVDPEHPRERFQFDEASFAKRLSDLARFRNEEQLPYIQLRPLIGLRLTGTIEVEPGLTIEPMTDDEITEALQWGVLPTHLDQFREFTNGPGLTHALKRRYTVPRVLLPQPPMGGAGNREHWAYGDDETVAHVLSIVAKGSVEVGPTFLSATIGWPYGIQGILQPRGFSDYRDDARDMALPPNVESNIQAGWRALKNATGAFRLAARRFYQGHLRKFVVDRLLDDAIATEALLLAGHQQQISRRFALHAAYYLGGTNQPERQRVFTLFRSVYRVRSSVVHGEEPDPTDMQIQGQPATLLDFEDAFESEVRRLFDQMVARGDSGRAIDWSRIVLGPNP